VTTPNLWGLERAGKQYLEFNELSEPQEDHEARVELYQILGMVLRSAMYHEEPMRRDM
jgi:hypothetical protein